MSKDNSNAHVPLSTAAMMAPRIQARYAMYRSTAHYGAPAMATAILVAVAAQQTAPHSGAPSRQTRQARLPSVHLHCRGRRIAVSAILARSCGHYSPATARLPRLVARGYLAAVYGPAIRDSFLLAYAPFGNPRIVVDSLSECIGGLSCRGVSRLLA